MQEKRRFVRSNGLVLVDYKGTKIEGKCSAFDISGVGLRLTLDKELELGVEVDVDLYLPGDSQPVKAKGKVVWLQLCKETEETDIEKKKKYYYAGIEFTHIGDDSKKKVINYVYRKLH